MKGGKAPGGARPGSGRKPSVSIQDIRDARKAYRYSICWQAIRAWRADRQTVAFRNPTKPEVVKEWEKEHPSPGENLQAAVEYLVRCKFEVIAAAVNAGDFLPAVKGLADLEARMMGAVPGLSGKGINDQDGPKGEDAGPRSIVVMLGTGQNAIPLGAFGYAPAQKTIEAVAGPPAGVPVSPPQTRTGNENTSGGES